MRKVRDTDPTGGVIASHLRNCRSSNARELIPTYDYKCHSCGGTYEVFHKVREMAEDIECPACGSRSHTRLLSAPAIAVSDRPRSLSSPQPPQTGGCCCNGACEMN